jgi:ABC-type sulfate/molybdate transport systems ATPase subunit
MEIVMIDLALKIRRGSFRLEIECKLAAEWTVVFGPSGAGKSTVLRLIAGLDRVSGVEAGRIAIRRRWVTDSAHGLHVRPGLRETGMVAQHSALFPHLSVAENVAYGLADLSAAKRKERIIAMLELVDGAGLADRSPRALSGGEAQRVALARTLAPMPRLLLLDEPLSALDAAARDEVLTRLQSWLGEHDIQTVLVTHDAADALATQAEVVVLREGRLIAQGPASTVLAAERERLIARLN